MTDFDVESDVRLLPPGDRPPSLMVALLPARTTMPGVSEVLGWFDESPLEVLERAMAPDREMGDSRWEMELRVAGDDWEQQCRVWVEPATELDEVHLEWGLVTEAELEASRAAEWAVGVSTPFGETPLADYHRQLRVLTAAAPEAVVFYDISAAWPRSAAWVREAAESAVPPAPENLYCVHAVYDDEVDDAPAWLHTHGLLRCGSIELEMLDVPAEHAGTLCQLLNATAALFMEHGPSPPGEPFPVGHELWLVWLPWPEGIRQVPRRRLGAAADRDDVHGQLAGVLVVPRRRVLGVFGRKYASPAVTLPVLQEDPLLYVSNMETDRMSRLAAERLGRFRQLQERYRSDEDWLFLVKLGLPVDEAEEPEDREHLWFEVHELTDQDVDATLVNQPYGIAGLAEGQRGRYPLASLSDWTILCPHGRFDPDSVGHLEREL